MEREMKERTSIEKKFHSYINKNKDKYSLKL